MLKMLANGNEDSHRFATASSLQPAGFARLDLEIRFMIWRLAYTLQGPRIVEVRTKKHNDCGNHQGWCPRYSPSPAPTIVNVCSEAREEVRKMAQRAGHLLFATASDSPSIYFNPAIDTLYVPNEKEYWIRDWGPEGILTQFKKEHQPEILRLLAIGLDPVERGTSTRSLESDLDDFQQLEEIIFVVRKLEKKIFDRIQALDNLLRFLKAMEARRAQQRASENPRKYPDECKLAMKCGGYLKFIEKNAGEHG